VIRFNFLLNSIVFAPIDMDEWDQFVARAEPDTPMDRIAGMIYGHVLGDVMGRGSPPEGWSSGTDQLIILAQSLATGLGGVDAPAAVVAGTARRLADWVSHGFPELGARSCDGYTKTVVTHKDFVTDPSGAAVAIWENSKRMFAGNTSMVRSSVIGALPDDVAKYAALLSQVTHADERCSRACVIQAGVLHNLIYRGVQHPSNVDALLAACIGHARAEPSADERELSSCVRIAYTANIDQLKLGDVGTSSYVHKTVSCCVYALQVIKVALANQRVPNYKKFIELVVSKGGDASANAAVAGAVMGAYLGLGRLPAELVAAIPNRVMINSTIMTVVETVTRLISAAQPTPPDEVTHP
jgi:ADP-ribosylglycohydrolase